MKQVCALQTDLNQPLGQRIGNALEVRECIEIMGGEANAADLMEVTLELAAEMLQMARVTKNLAHAKQILQKRVTSGEALRKFTEMVSA